MMKDIDQKIKELEEEERKEQEEEEKKKAQAKNKQTKPEFDIEDTKEIPKVKKEVKEPVKVSKKEPEEDVELLFDNVDDAPTGGPVVNVDKDSVVVKENVVSDDEFFDDFFDDNE